MIAMKYDVASITDIGKVRSNNQDRVLALTGYVGSTRTVLLAVADGMGGLACGEKASGIAVNALETWWNQRSEAKSMEEMSAELDAAIFEAHRQIYYLAEQIGQQTGSTLSLVYMQEEEFFVKQIGDSRVYASRSGVLQQLTDDQTWANQMIRSGEMTPEQAYSHRLSHALVNALGVSSELEIATQWGTASRGMVFLVCSDGFYNELPAERLYTILKRETSAQMLRQLMTDVLAGPARDNASAVICRVL